MPARKSVLQFALLFTISVSHLAYSHNCIYTDETCTCSLKPASGTCYRQHTPGFCTKVQCNPSWKCDCFAPSHICTRRECTKYEPLPDINPAPSGDVPCIRKASPLCASSLLPLGPDATPSIFHHSHGPTSDLNMETTLSPSPSPSPSPTCHPDDHDQDQDHDHDHDDEHP